MLFNDNGIIQKYFDFVLSGPEILLLTITLAILLFKLFDEKDLFNTFRLTIFTISLFSITLAIQWRLKIFGSAFHGLFIVDELSYFLKIISCITLMISLFYGKSSCFLQSTRKRDEFYLIILFFLFGQNIVISAGNLVSVYLGLELTALSSCALIALNHKNHASLEAAMKYFILGSLASGLLLYGMSIIYGITNQLDLNLISSFLRTKTSSEMNIMLVLGTIFIFSGLAFKLSIAPFHMWIPDVYQGTSTMVVIILNSVSKFGPFTIMLRFSKLMFENISIDWYPSMLFFSCLSLALGSLAAIVQKNFKRMLAYSSISHMGFILLGLMVGLTTKNVEISNRAYAASLFYLLVDILSTLVSFGLILAISSAKRREFGEIKDFRGLNQYNGIISLLMLISMFSLAGIPPTAGFYSKIEIIQVLMQSGYILATVTAIFFSLVSVFYCLHIIQNIYFEKPLSGILKDIQLNSQVKKFLSINGSIIIFIGLFPSNLMNMCIYTVQQTFENKFGIV